MIRIKSLLESGAMLTVGLSMSACSHNGGQWEYNPDATSIGRIYYYERSNSDGSMGERITVFHRSETELEVYKENGLCSNAALVTANLDTESWSATRIVGGQLQPDAQHVEFAFLTWNREANQLEMEVRLPHMTIEDAAKIETKPWHLYDFDLASLTVMTPHLANPQAAFSFGMALLWADPTNPDPLFWMGDVVAAPDTEKEHLGYDARRYALSGSAFYGERSTGEQGVLWLDAEEGHIVDAVFPTPNHPGYTDFRLRLDRISDGGLTEWVALLRAHFEACDG